MRRTSVSYMAVALVTAAACGDNTEGGPGDLPDGPGRFDSPSDFDRSDAGCVRGGMAGVAPDGIFHFQVTYDDGFTGTGAARLDELGAWEYGGALAGGDATRAWLDDDSLFLYRDLGEDRSRSLLLCEQNGGELHGQYAYCTPEDCFLARATARRVEPLDEPVAGGLTLLGEHAGAGWGDGITVNVRVQDGLAYLARYQDGLRIVDVSNPSAPVDVGHGPCEHPGDNEIYNDVKLVDAGDRRYAIMGSNRVGAVVWDVTTPASPSIVAHFGTADIMEGANIHTLFIDGGKAYLANTRRGLEIWSLADPRAPQLLSQFFPRDAPDGAFLHDLFVEGDRAYLNFWNAGMVIADVSNPAAPRDLGTFVGYGDESSHSSWVTTVGARRIAAHGDEEWGSHLRFVDVTEGSGSFLRQVGEWQTRPEVSAHNIMAAGTEVFAAYYQDGVRVIDISDPAAPRLAAWFNTWPGYDRAYGTSFFEAAVGIDLDLARGRIYVADSHRGLLILQR
ncbi:MAG TPA: hypothetical protein VM261_18830 [Kofleriaceae bacterium]|nr:hypothetical protein [Kofleriaceae bacterium]